MSSEEDTPAPQPATATAAQGSFHTGGLAGVGGAAEGGYRDNGSLSQMFQLVNKE